MALKCFYPHVQILIIFFNLFAQNTALVLSKFTRDTSPNPEPDLNPSLTQFGYITNQKNLYIVNNLLIVINFLDYLKILLASGLTTMKICYQN